jgi:hypothetical protein
MCMGKSSVSITYILRLLVVLLSVFALNADTYAATIRVPSDQPTIQAGIIAAVDGDTVLLADGTYTGDGNRDVHFLGKKIVVTSENGPQFTIINCQADSAFPHRGIIFDSSEDSLSVLSGIQISGGFAPGDLTLLQSNGGGILCDSGTSPTICNCIITNNVALNSGGGIAALNSNPNIVSCVISNNTAKNASKNAIAGFGGGIRFDTSNARLTNCTVIQNVSIVGGGIAAHDSKLTVDSCLISLNIADILYGFDPYAAGVGGGIYLGYSIATLNDCLITKNTAKTMFGALFDEGKGGGFYGYYSETTFSNCTIVDNTAEGWPSVFSGQGAGISAWYSNLDIHACILAFNNDGESIHVGEATAVLIDCSDIYGNFNGDWIAPIDTFEFLNGNLSVDPVFCDTAQSNFALASNSICLPNTNSCNLRVGALDVGCIASSIQDPYPIESTKDAISLQAYPNPFNSEVTLTFVSPRRQSCEMQVFNPLGQRVYTIGGVSNIGINEKSWSPSGHASGIYFAILKIGGQTLCKNLLYLK